MKETVQYSIGGYAFTLEKDASAQLQEYIGALEKHYLSQDGGKEIMEGIEERVAELLLDKCGHGGVVSLEHVQAVIRVIGRPERIEADDPGPSGSSRDRQNKRLFRDIDNKRLGGVCAGLAAYLQMDVIIFRVAFIVVTLLGCLSLPAGILFVGAPLVYCILWVTMPAARSAQDRWAMRGDGVTADEISRNIQAGFEEIGKTAHEVGNSDLFMKFCRAVGFCLGIIFLIVAASGLASIAIISINGLGSVGITWSLIQDMIVRHLPSTSELFFQPWFVAALAMTITLPFVGLLYASVQMIFAFKSPSWKPGLVIFVLWLISVVVLAVSLSTSLITNECVETIQTELFL
jgi:phage shock protein PspC (stress-responsive transcriptional regulator)